MEKEKRTRWTSGRKLDLILESLKGNRTTAEICRGSGISQSQFHEWKKAFLDAGEQGLRNRGRTDRERDLEDRLRLSERKVGELVMKQEILEMAVDISKKKPLRWRLSGKADSP